MSRRCVPWWILALLAGGMGVAQAKEGFEVRGTILCSEEGDPERARPLREQFLIAIPSLAPDEAEIVSQDGLFRFTLPKAEIDRLLHVRILRGRELIAVVTEYLEPAKLKRLPSGDLYYVIPAHLLPWDCDSLSVPLAEAESALGEIRSEPSFQPASSSSAKRLPAAAGAVAAAGGAVAAAAGAKSGGGVSILVMPDLEGELLFYARHAFTGAPGRSLLSWRDREHVAPWNPSALVFGSTPFLAAEAGSQPVVYASASMPLRRVSAPDFHVPVDVVSVSGFYREGDRRAEDGTLQTRKEALGVVGAGKMLFPRISVGVAGRVQHRFSTKKKDGETFADLDLSGTWVVTDRIQAAVAVNGVLGAEVDWGKEHRDLREATAALLWSPPRVEAGVEVSYTEEERAEAVAGLSVRLTNWLALDVGGGTRYEMGSGGVSLRWRELTFRGRIRYDESEEWTGQGGLSWRAW